MVLTIYIIDTSLKPYKLLLEWITFCSLFCILTDFAGVGAWKYIEQHRHAYFDKMQVIPIHDVLATLLPTVII